MTQSRDRWLLPTGIQEILPPEADRMERQRRAIIDLFSVWGYELVVTPFIEFLESLLTATGPDLDLQTFKLIDRVTGRSMGIRADMTPQVARIDAHHLVRPGPVRLCYLGTVLHTLPDGFSASRTPMQVGAELYGHAGVESDCEIICLMLQTLGCVGVREVHLDIGHMGIFRGLAAEAGLSEEAEAALFDALQRKARSEIEVLLNQSQLTPELSLMMLSLIDLNGGRDVIETAKTVLRAANQEVQDSLRRLEALSDALSSRLPDVALHFDLAELRGYRYERGVVFAAFVPGRGEEVARGGRYDGIGEVFGRARPAIGFSTDLSTLAAASGSSAPVPPQSIFAPWLEDAALHRKVAALRASGVRVVQGLPGQVGGAAESGCDRSLVRQNSDWVVELHKGIDS